MKEDLLIKLWAKKLAEGLSVEEEQQLERLLAEDVSLREEVALLEETWRLSAWYAKEPFQPDERAAWAALQQRLKMAGPESVHRSVLWRRLAAAAVLLLLFVGGYFLFKPVKTPILTVEAREQPRLVRLPDGSVVELSPATVLRYPERFEKQRHVVLEGEAYFRVAKDSAHPFVVSARAGEVRVLGTRFLYSSRPGALEERVLVEEGRVAYRPEGVPSVLLIAGEAAVYHLAKANLEKQRLNPNLLFWQTGRLVFRGVPLSEVLDELEKIFNVRFNRAEIQPLLACKQTLAFSNKPDLEAVLHALESHLHWEAEQVEPGVWHLRAGRCE